MIRRVQLSPPSFLKKKIGIYIILLLFDNKRLLFLTSVVLLTTVYDVADLSLAQAVPLLRLYTILNNMCFQAHF